MNVREEDRVSAVALVVESEARTSAAVAGELSADAGPIEVSSDGGADLGAGGESPEPGVDGDGASPPPAEE
jgi:hypothetical protein